MTRLRDVIAPPLSAVQPLLAREFGRTMPGRGGEYVARLASAWETPVPRVLVAAWRRYEPFLRMIYQGRGRKVRALFDRNDLPPRERQIRNRIRKEGFWMR